ncbi:hypothetical protein Agub_g129 [Astrephomene gubernaculifera]|uniref:Uncharacterized protein n=1 Tax=Astrephomene gubernaculifera TaxID=47775 RepID=A0AAD3DDI5_9CHLO|nr:hypothetical protein Agub_g129 [Astrephomene gubernaculifera]
MAFGGMDLEALRAELTAARQERAALLQQVVDMEPLAMQTGAPDATDPSAGTQQEDGFQGFPPGSLGQGWGGAPVVEAQTRAVRKLSWGTPRGTTSLSASTSIFTPLSATAASPIPFEGAPVGAGGAWQPAGGWHVTGPSSRPGSDPPAPSDAMADMGIAAAASPPRRASSANAAGAAPSFFGTATASTGIAAAAAAAAAAAGGPGPADGMDSARTGGVTVSDVVAAGAGSPSREAGGSNPHPTPPLPPQPPSSASQLQAAVSSPRPQSASVVAWTSNPGGIGSMAPSATAVAAAAAAAAAAAGCRANPSLNTNMGGLGGLVGGGMSSSVSGAVAGGSGSGVASPGGAMGAMGFPAVKLSASPGRAAVAAAAARAAAAAAATATTGQPSVPWAAHHGANPAGAGIDLEAHRRAVLKEVLAAVLGEPVGSAKLEHLRLDVETVAAYVKQRTAEAAAAAASEAEERVRAGQAERHAKAVRAAEEALKRDMEEARKNMEEEKRRVIVKLDKLRGQLADAERDRKSLTGKSGQQARELREAKEALQLSKHLMSTAQTTADQKAKALARVQAELEKVRTEAAAAAEAAEMHLAAAREETAAARRDAVEQVEAAEVRAEAEAEAHAMAAAHEAALAAVRAEAAAAVGAAEAAWQAMAQAVEEVVAEAGRVTGDVSTELAEVQAELAVLKTDLTSMRAAFREELRAMRDAAYAAIGGFHAACRTAARAHAERTAQLLGLDETLKRLGPGGVAQLVAEVESLKGQLAEAKAATERAAAEAAAGSAAYRRAAANAELKARELQMMAASHGDLTTELAAVRAQAAAAQEECTELRKASETLRSELQQARDEAAQNNAALRAGRRELEAAMGALQRSEAAAAAARVEAEQWKSSAADHLAAGRQEATAVAATLLAELRDRYFQTLPLPAGTTGGTAAAAARGSPSRPPPGGGGGTVPEAEGSAAAGGGGGAKDAADGGSSSVGGGVSELEAAVGVRLYDVTHDRVMAAFETYLSRQALLAGAPGDVAAAAAEGSGERDVSPLRSRLPEAPAAAFGAAAGSLSPVPGAPMPGVLLRPMDPAQQQQQAHVAAAVAAAAAGGWQRPLVSEVVWLEGCLLVALLDLRLNGGRSNGAGSGSVGGSGSSGGGANREGGREASSSSRPNSSSTSGASTSAQQQQAVRGLVAQLVRTMASERRQLMQRVRQLQAGGGGGSGLLPPSHPSPVSFLSYAGAGRRTLALTSPSMAAGPGRGSGGVGVRTASLTATLAAIPGAGPSPSALTSELSRYSTGPYGSTASAAAAGLLDVEMSTTSQRRGGGGRGGGGGGGNGRAGGGGAGALLSTSSTSPVRSSVRRSTDTDAVLPAPLANLYKSESGGMALPATTSMPAVPLQATNSECLLPPLPGNHYHPTQHAGHSPGHSPGPAQGPCSHATGGGPGAPLQAPDMDELMDVLQYPYSGRPDRPRARKAPRVHIEDRPDPSRPLRADARSTGRKQAIAYRSKASPARAPAPK